MSRRGNGNSVAKHGRESRDGERFPWWPTIVTSIISASIGGLLVWVVQERSQRQQREADVATTVAIAVANDLRFSGGIAEATREKLIKRQLTGDFVQYAAVYSPVVDIPPVTDASIMRPAVVTALDMYRRTLAECAKHRQLLIEAWKENSPPSNAKALVFVYCVSLDSVVCSELSLLTALETEYPFVSKFITEPAPYRPLKADMPEIDKILMDPSA